MTKLSLFFFRQCRLFQTNNRQKNSTLMTEDVVERLNVWAHHQIKQLAEEKTTNTRPSHFSKYDTTNKTYYRQRSEEELKVQGTHPYFTTRYEPPNDQSTPLYNFFRQSSTPGYTLALNEKPKKSFVPGTAQPYLVSHARLYSNHYQRLAPESELGDWIYCALVYTFIIIFVGVQSAPFIAHYSQPELGGAFYP